MKKITKVFICLTAVILLVSGCSSTSGKGNAVLEFFGFNTSAGKQPSADTTPAQKAQNSPQADSDPFGVDNHASTETGLSMADLGWDDVDPALVDLGTSGAETKSGNSEGDDWKTDPDAWSFSSSSFDPEAGSLEQKEVAGIPGQYPDNPNQRPSYPGYTFYHIQNCPVFCPIRQLPHTGITTEMSTGIKESVSYTATNMTLSIPGLNLSEEIVVVPMVEDNYPVESLGEKIGLLEGSGPGPEDLFVLVGHNHIDMQQPGPFLELSALKESDLIFVNGAKNASRTFVVYANEKFDANDIEGLLSYAKPGCMILITCEDEAIEGGYLNRRVIFAESKED